ncbi:hypothetical protein CAP48_02900 [Advenella sp. S44]|nr:hypothetical protein CAP48_02900 [Advenella sp. S44]
MLPISVALGNSEHPYSVDFSRDGDIARKTPTKAIATMDKATEYYCCAAVPRSDRQRLRASRPPAAIFAISVSDAIDVFASCTYRKTTAGSCGFAR